MLVKLYSQEELEEEEFDLKEVAASCLQENLFIISYLQEQLRNHDLYNEIIDLWL